MKQSKRALVVLSLALASAQAGAQHAHVHGNAELQVALDGPSLTLMLSSPLENLLGFEHAPRTDKQKAAAQALAERLAKPERLFVPTREAQCSPVASVIDAPVLGWSGSKGGTVAKEGAAAGRRPSAHKHDKPDGDGHAEIMAQFTFRCEQAAALKGVEVRLFDAFKGIRRINAQVAGPAGQKAARLSASQRVVSW
jgi:hypothetical protein